MCSIRPGYGALTINKAISINGTGAGILTPAGVNAITIDAGPSDFRFVRGVVINGARVGLNGILFNTGASLTVERCVVRGFYPVLAGINGGGILFRPTDSGNLAVSDTYVFDNYIGIYLSSLGSNPTTVVINRVASNYNDYAGIYVSPRGTGSMTVAATDTVVVGNGRPTPYLTGGFVVYSYGAPATLTVTNSVAANNDSGVASRDGFNGLIRIGRSLITNNVSGWQGSTIQSYGDNYIDGNVNGDTGPPLIAQK